AGPVSEEALSGPAPLPPGAPAGAPLTVLRLRTGLARLEAEGSAIHLPDGRWCARHLLVRLHAASRNRRRHAVTPASIADLVRFLARWQHVGPGQRLEGRQGVLTVIEQLQGVEIPAGDWEEHVLPARVAAYDPRWLDELCLSGEVAWGRLTPRPDTDTARGASTPSRATPLTLVLREDLAWQLAAVRTGEPVVEPATGAAADVLAALRARGACFRADLAAAAGRLPAEVDEGLWDLVARGIITADAFSAVRSLLSARARWASRQRRGPGRRPGLGMRRAVAGTGMGEGRWALLPTSPGAPGPEEPTAAAAVPGALTSGAPTSGATTSGVWGTGLAEQAADELAEAVAWQLLTRWGVVAWELWARESYRIPWRAVVRGLRRLEAWGLALGGRFVAGLSGEQYALPDAADLLGPVRRDAGRADAGSAVGAASAGNGRQGGGGGVLDLAATDPLNLTGTVVPGPRVPAVRHRRVVVQDGTVVA